MLALGHLLSGLSLVPSGAGVFEGLLTVLIMTAGVAPSSGAAAGLVYRGYNDILTAGAGVIAATLLRRDRPAPPPGRSADGHSRASPRRARPAPAGTAARPRA